MPEGTSITPQNSVVNISSRLLATSSLLAALISAWRSSPGTDHQPHDRLRDRHEQRGRNAFAANVADRDHDPVPVQLDDIVQVAADFARRHHVRENIELAFGEVARLHARQHGPLNGRGARHLRLVRAPLSNLRGHDAVGDDEAIADRGAERGERGQQRLDQRHRQRVAKRNRRARGPDRRNTEEAERGSGGPERQRGRDGERRQRERCDPGADAAEFDQRVAPDADCSPPWRGCTRRISSRG